MAAAGFFTVVTDVEVENVPVTGRVTVKFQHGGDYFGPGDLETLGTLTRTGNMAKSVGVNHEIELPTDIGSGGSAADSLVGYDLTWFNNDTRISALFPAQPANSVVYLSDLVSSEPGVPPASSVVNVAEAKAARDEAVAAAASASAISGLTGEDDAVALLHTTPGSDTRIAGNKIFGGVFRVTDPQYAGGAVFDSNGLTGNGTDNTAAILACIDAAIAAYTSGLVKGVAIELPHGIGRVTAPIKRRQAGVPLSIRGQGAGQTYLFGDFVGAGEGILDLSNDTDTNRTRFHRVKGIGFLGRGTVGDPVGLMMQNVSGAVVDDIDAPSAVPVSSRAPLANSVIVCTNDNNSKWSNIRSNGGFQPLAFPMTNTNRVSFTAGQTTVDATESVFTSAMVGYPIYFTTGGATGDNEQWKSTVAGYTSPTRVTIADPAPESKTTARACVGHIRGTVANGSTQLTIDKIEGLSSAYVGMMVHVMGARLVTDISSPGLLSTTITAVDPATRTITLAAPATVAVTNAVVLFASALFIGAPAPDPNDLQTNHSWWRDVHLEGYQSAGLIANKVLYTDFDNLKIHGASLGTANDWNRSYYCAVLSEVKSLTIDGIQADHTIMGPKIHVSGSRGQLTVNELEVGRVWKDTALIEGVGVTGNFRLRGSLYFMYALTGFADTYRPVSMPHRVNNAIGYVSRRDGVNKRSFAGPTTTPGVTAQDGTVSIPVGTTYVFRPPGTFGVLHLEGTASGVNGRFFFRTSEHSSGVAITSREAGTETMAGTAGTTYTGTTGTNGRVTVAPDSSGNIQIENRRGSGTAIAWIVSPYGS